MRRFLRVLGTVFVVSGSLLLADAATTLAWQEPVSYLLGRISQNGLSGDLDRLEKGPLSALESRALRRLSVPTKRIAFLARAERRRVKAGQAIGRIRIPRIRASYVVVQGTATADLKKGPGHYDDTAWPGLPGTVAIAGHRTTYLAPFRHVDSLRPGDSIVLEMPYARLTYAVEKTKIVPPTALYIKRRVGYDRLVLSACHPVYSAAQRIVIFARLKGVVPRGRALS